MVVYSFTISVVVGSSPVTYELRLKILENWDFRFQENLKTTRIYSLLSSLFPKLKILSILVGTHLKLDIELSS